MVIPGFILQPIMCLSFPFICLDMLQFDSASFENFLLSPCLRTTSFAKFDLEVVWMWLRLGLQSSSCPQVGTAQMDPGSPGMAVPSLSIQTPLSSMSVFDVNYDVKVSSVRTANSCSNIW